MKIKALLVVECYECWRELVSDREAANVEKENENSGVSENWKEALTA